MKRYSFALHLIALAALMALMNACVIANYQIAAQEPKKGRTNLAAKDDDAPVYFVIPRYYKVHIGCDFSTCSEHRDFLGTQIYNGVSAAINEMPLGKPVEFTEHIQSKGLVCVVTVNELNDGATYSELLSAATLFVVPAYTTRKYVLSYSLLLDSKKAKEYELHIAEKAISGLVSWLLFPVVYPFWNDIKIGGIRYEFGPTHGPPDSVIREITKTFLLEARRDGIL